MNKLKKQALTYMAVGDYTKAEPLLRRALESLENTLGPDHPDVVKHLKEMARFYVTTSEYAKAESLLMRVLAIHEMTLGPDNPAVEWDLIQLAILYETENNYAKAEPLVERALTIRERIAGPDGRSLWPLLEHLAVIYRLQGKYAMAESYYLQELATFEKNRVSDWPCFETVDILRKLVALCQESGDTSKALDYTRRAEQQAEELIRNSPAGQIPKYAAEQYSEWKARDANLTDGEIAQRIFSLRYPSRDPNFDIVHFQSYLEGNFKWLGLVDFCLAAFDIEGGVSPTHTTFHDVIHFVETELERHGLHPAKEEGGTFIDRWHNQVGIFR